MREEMDWHNINPVEGKPPVEMDRVLAETLEGMEEESPEAVIFLKRLTPEEREQFDREILNSAGLSWSALGAVEADDMPRILGLIEKWRAEGNKEKRKALAKEIAGEL